MNKVAAACLMLLSSSLSFAQEQALQECSLLVARAWIAMGATSFSGCLKFAQAEASQGERQFAKFGSTYLQIQGDSYFQSVDGGTWEPVTPADSAAPVSTLKSLNVLRVPSRPRVKPP
jgi:hypothetical protein